MRFFQPCDELRDLVVRLYAHQADAPEAGASRPWLIVPDGEIKVIFPCRGDISCTIGGETRVHRAGRIIVSAMRSVPGALAFPDGVDAIGVIIRPETAYRLFGVPQGEIANRTLDGEELFGAAARRWQERLSDLPRVEDRVTALQAQLCDFMRARRYRQDAAYEFAVRRLRAAGGCVRVEQLAREIGCSRRTLERRFQEHAGVGAKTLADILRFHGVYRRLRHRPGARYADIIARGYVDQSHFLKAFRRYTGVTPRVYRDADDYGRLYIPH